MTDAVGFPRDVVVVGGCGHVGLPLAILGFQATTSLDTVLDEVIPWIADTVEAGAI